MSTTATTIDPERQMLGEVEMVGRERWEQIHRRAARAASAGQRAPLPPANPWPASASQHASRADVGRPRRSRSRAPGWLLRLHYYSWRVGEKVTYSFSG